jgi:HEAT repeat protein
MTITFAAVAAHAAEPVVAPAGGGLGSLAVRVELDARSVYVGGKAVPIGLDATQLPAMAEVTNEVVAIGSGRHVVHVRVPAKDAPGLAWEGIFAAGRPPIFAGLTGLTGGDPGERTGKAVQIRRGDPTSFVLVGDVREELGICGQSVTLFDPQALYPSSLELRPATVQRLSPEAQARATEVTATEKGEHPDAPLARLLVARGSSVPDDRGAALTDGDASTSWTEQRPGVGQGEFVVMAAPRDVPVARVQIAVSGEGSASGAAPRTVYLATATRTFRVALPTDGWVKQGRTFEVTFPEPIEASCLSLVLDTAYTRGIAHPDVSVSEVVGYSEFDVAGATLADVAAKLSGPRGGSAAQVLERAGDGALDAVAKTYDALEPHGRALAMDIASSHEKCGEAVPLLTKGLCEREGEAPRKAREKIDRCRSGAPALAAQLRDDAARRACLAPVLAQLAPTEALAPLADAMGRADEGDRGTREALRSAFAMALRANPPGALSPLLADARTPPAGRLEVMRASGPRVAEAHDEAEATVTQLLGGPAPAAFRARYLVLEPLAELARAGDHAAAQRIADAIAHDTDWPVRAHAAELAAQLDEAKPALAAAARDPEPRVREAAIASLARTPTQDGVRAALEVLAGDAWPFVRTQAVALLAAGGPAAAVDDALGAALSDPSARVRGGAVLALGKHRSMPWRDKVRARLGDAGEDTDVRAEAAWALGAMCDAGSADPLTRLARNLTGSDVTEEARQLGLAALIALAAMQPSDLRDRLGPLLAKEAPADVRRAADKAMSARGSCH